jgi:Mn2+/Fe2+ NRAMP family transporter
MAKDIIEKIAEAPAAALDATITEAEHIAESIPTGNTIKKTKEYWNVLGPGLTTGASDDDPSGIATYSQTGAQYGFQLLWLSMAKAVQLLNGGVNFYVGVIGFALVSILLQIYLPYARYAHYLKWLAMILLTYIASALMAHLDWGSVLQGAFHPSIQWNKEQIILICAILGTTISPYLFFWQTSQEVESQILKGKTTVAQRKKSTNPHAIRAMRLDVWTGMLLSNVVMFFIIAACGAILFPQGITQIHTASEAAEALRPFAGDATYFLFALGIIGTGLLAIPVLAGSSSYAVSEGFKWREGLNRKLRQAHAFYGVILFSVLIGLGMNFLGIDPIKALIYSAVANGIVAPVVLVLIVLIGSNKRIMGEWVNKRSTTVIGWGVTFIMIVAGVAAIYSMLS